MTSYHHGQDQSDERLMPEAKKIGFPLMIKAVRGGGEKGMRIAETETDSFPMLQSARTESKKAFGDSSMLLERYVRSPRHIEVQVFADHFHGLFVRAGLFGSETSSENYRGSPRSKLVGRIAGSAGRSSDSSDQGGDLCRCRNCGIHPGQRRFVVPVHGDKHPTAGGASDYRNDHRYRSRGENLYRIIQREAFYRELVH